MIIHSSSFLRSKDNSPIDLEHTTLYQVHVHVYTYVELHVHSTLVKTVAARGERTLSSPDKPAKPTTLTVQHADKTLTYYLRMTAFLYIVVTTLHGHCNYFAGSILYRSPYFMDSFAYKSH